MDYDVTKLKTPEDCRIVMERAKNRGLTDIYNKVFEHYCHLSGRAIDDSSDQIVLEFEMVLAAYEQLLTEKNGRTTKASRTRQKMARHGVLKCLHDWALADQETEGFKLLVSKGMPQFTAEYLVVKYEARFEANVVQSARARLIRHGLVVPQND